MSRRFVCQQGDAMRKSFLSLLAVGLIAPELAVAENTILAIPKGRPFELIYYRSSAPVTHVTLDYRPIGATGWTQLLDNDVMPLGKPIPVVVDSAVERECVQTGCELRIGIGIVGSGSVAPTARMVTSPESDVSRSVQIFVGGDSAAPNTVVTLTLR